MARVVELDRGGMFPLAFSWDTRLLAVGMERLVQVWRVTHGDALWDFPMKPKGVYSVAFSPDGRWLAMGAADKRVRIWEVSRR